MVRGKRVVVLTTAELHAEPTAPIPGASCAERIVIRGEDGDVVLMRQTRALPKEGPW